MQPARFKQPPPFSAAASTRLDLLRLFLIAQVMLGHFAMIAYPTFGQLDLHRMADLFVALYRLVTRFGGEAAFVFVGISGFLLGPRLLAIGLRQSDAPTIPAFLRARLRRIYPTLVAALLLTALCDWTGVYQLGGEQFYRRVASYDAVARLTWQAALGNLLSLQPAFAGAFGSNGPLWTLGYIVEFYVIGAVLAGVMRIDKRLALVLLAGLMGLGLVWYPQWSLLLGAWLGCALMRWFPARSASAGWTCLGLGLGSFVLSNLVSDGLDVILAALAALLWLAALQCEQLPLRLVRLPAPLARTNAASFALYAFHFPLAILLYVILAPWFDLNGLGFRLAWPMLAAVPGLALALAWQRALAVLLPERR